MKALVLVGLLLATVCSSYAADSTELENRSDVFASTCKLAIDISEGNRESLPQSQEDLMQYVKKTSECFNYIKGFIDGHNMTADHAGNTKQFCIPSGVAYIQVARLVVKASDDRPEIGHYPRETIVEYVLKSTWPCDASDT